MRRKQVYIADREKLVISAITELLASLPEPVSICGYGIDAEEVLQDFAAYAPDILFVDERLSCSETMPLYAAVSETYPQTTLVLMYSGMAVPDIKPDRSITCASKATLDQEQFSRLWASLSAHPSAKRNLEEPPDIRKIKEYIQEHLEEDLALETVARKFNYNYSYLSSYFSRLTKKSFKQYTNELRIQQACRLLLSGQASISEAGHLVGFPNQSYFTQVFKKYTGFTPNAYRMIHYFNPSEASCTPPEAYPYICERSG